MDELESPTDAIEAESGFKKSWAALSEDLRQCVKRHAPHLAGVPKVPVLIAIVGNAANVAQGSWQYSIDGDKTWIDIPISELSDTNAIVLPLTALRFNLSANWYGTPGSLTARAWDGTGEPPAIGEQDISANIGAPGHWSADTFVIGDATGLVVVRGNALTTANAVWDRLGPQGRRAAVLQADRRKLAEMEALGQSLFKEFSSVLGPALFGDEWKAKLSVQDEWLIGEAKRYPNDVLIEAQSQAADQRRQFMEWQHDQVKDWLLERGIRTADQFEQASYARRWPSLRSSWRLSTAHPPRGPRFSWRR